MCCIFTTLLFLGPRFAAVVWWLLSPGRWFGTPVSAFNSILWPILGIIFLPWTTLMYVLLVPFGGFWDWLLIILAVIFDISVSGGGLFGNRRRFGF